MSQSRRRPVSHGWRNLRMPKPYPEANLEKAYSSHMGFRNRLKAFKRRQKIPKLLFTKSVYSVYARLPIELSQSHDEARLSMNPQQSGPIGPLFPRHFAFLRWIRDSSTTYALFFCARACAPNSKTFFSVLIWKTKGAQRLWRGIIIKNWNFNYINRCSVDN